LAQSRWQFMRLSPYDARPATVYGRHCRACPGNPSLKKSSLMDARVKPAHDEMGSGETQ